MKRTYPLALALALLVSHQASAAKPNPYLGQAKVFYQGLEYEKCLARLKQAAKWPSDPGEQVEIELYAGLCHFNIGDLDAAKERFDLALGMDPKLELPPYTSPRIAELFEASRTRAEAKLARMGKKTEPVAEKAPEEKHEEAQPQTDDRPKVTTLTPAPTEEREPEVTTGVESEKHFTAPLALGATSVVASGVGIFFGMQAKGLEGQANAAKYESDAFKYGQQAGQNATIANVAFGVAATAAVGAVVSYFVLN